MRRLAMLGIALAAFGAHPAHGDAPGGASLFEQPSETQPFHLESETLEYESQRKLYVARGGPVT